MAYVRDILTLMSLSMDYTNNYPKNNFSSLPTDDFWQNSLCLWDLITPDSLVLLLCDLLELFLLQK